jgi:hypothetical protein
METAWTNTPSDSFRPFVRNPLITLDKICQPTSGYGYVSGGGDAERNQENGLYCI